MGVNIDHYTIIGVDIKDKTQQVFETEEDKFRPYYINKSCGDGFSYGW